MYKCRICDWSGEIPPDAVEIDLARSRGARRGKLYKFGGVVHDLRKLPEPPGPPIMAKPNPPVEQPLIQEVQPPVPEPIMVEEVKPEVVEIEDESELTAITALAMAFRRSKKNSR
jgi:hypothetical protein